MNPPPPSRFAGIVIAAAVTSFVADRVDAQVMPASTIQGAWHEGANAGPPQNPLWFNESPVFFGTGSPPPQPDPYGRPNWVTNTPDGMGLRTTAVIGPGNESTATYRYLPWTQTWTEDSAIVIPDPSAGVRANIVIRRPATPPGPGGPNGSPAYWQDMSPTQQTAYGTWNSAVNPDGQGGGA